jgi:membrane protease YdiL (CAAX protease family)
MPERDGLLFQPGESYTMNASITSVTLGREVPQTSRVHRAGLFAIFLVFGLAIFFFGCNYYEIFSTNRNIVYQITISAVFLLMALWARRVERWNKYRSAVWAFFIASMVVTVTSLLGGWSDAILEQFDLTVATSQGNAVAKVYEMAMVVVPIAVLTKLSGADLGSIFIKRGNLKMGLGFGLLVFFNLATAAFLFFAERFTSADRLLAAAVWGLVFAFANGFLEELWLRGIFLKRFEPLLGLGGSVLLTSIVFAMMHGGAMYLTPAAIPFMLANTFTLGLACGYLMMKADSILGAVLIHAGADIFLFVAMVANV